MGDEVRSQVPCEPLAGGFGLKPFCLTKFTSCMCVLTLLTGCSFGDGGNGGRASAPPPQQQESAAPKGPTAMDAFRALAPSEGLKFTPLFVERMDDSETRFRRLEEAVQSLRNDFDTVVPTMVRLVSVEKDIKDLVGQLQTLTAQEGIVDVEPIPVPEAPVPVVQEKPIKQPKEIQQTKQDIPGEGVVGGIEKAPANVAAADSAASSSLVTPGAALAGLPPEGAAPTSLAKPPAPEVKAAPAVQAAPVVKAAPVAVASKPAIGDVKSVRIGDHLDKTRIVLDLTAKPDFTASLENGGKRLVIDLPRLKWATAPQWEADAAALVSAYAFKDGKLSMDLLYASEISAKQVLPPSGESGSYRLVIDLFSPDVHEK